MARLKVWNETAGEWQYVVSPPAGGGEQELVQSQAFSLTAQQIKDSTLTPHTIVPAQGAGTIVVPTLYVFNFAAGATPFNGDTVELVYGDLNLNTIFAGLTGGGYLGWTMGAFNLGTTEGGDPASYENKPVRLRAALRGSIATSDVGAGGADYAVGDTGTVDFGGPDATYIVTGLGAAGAVDAPGGFTITDGGDGYNLAVGGGESDWTTTPGGAQPGAGAGFEVQVQSVDASGSAGDGTLSGVVYYVVADLT